MKTMILLAGLLLSIPAHADYTENGSIIVKTTITIQGQNAAGYSIAVSSSIDIGGCIRFGIDGSVQCRSATGSGGGNVVLNATQTFTGANKFVSTVTVGPIVYTTTAALGGIALNTWTVVGSTRPDGSDAVIFTNLNSSTSWKLHWILSMGNDAGGMLCYFNTDTGATYKFSNTGRTSAGSAIAQNDNADTRIEIYSFSLQPNEGFRGELAFDAVPKLPKQVFWQSRGQSMSSSTVVDQVAGGGRYVGGTELKSINCKLSGGAWSGMMWLEALVLAPRGVN